MQRQGKSGTQNQQEMQGQKFHGQGIYPISDHDYNIVSALANELQGLEKFHEYAQNAQTSAFWQDAVQLKRQLAELFTHELAEHAREGHFGSGEKRSMQ